MLLTGFPAALVRSPDCTIWGSLRATIGTGNYPTSREPRKRAVDEHKPSTYVGWPTDHQIDGVISVQHHGSPSGHQKEARFRSPCIPRDHRRAQEVWGLPEATGNLCARGQ